MLIFSLNIDLNPIVRGFTSVKAHHQDIYNVMTHLLHFVLKFNSGQPYRKTSASAIILEFSIVNHNWANQISFSHCPMRFTFFFIQSWPIRTTRIFSDPSIRLIIQSDKQTIKIDENRTSQFKRRRIFISHFSECIPFLQFWGCFQICPCSNGGTMAG